MTYLTSIDFTSFDKPTYLGLSGKPRTFLKVGDSVLVHHNIERWATAIVTVLTKELVTAVLQLNSGAHEVQLPVDKISAILSND